MQQFQLMLVIQLQFGSYSVLLLAVLQQYSWLVILISRSFLIRRKVLAKAEAHPRVLQSNLLMKRRTVDTDILVLLPIKFFNYLIQA